MANEDEAWFAAKTFGYGSGLPIRWQGWALLSAHGILTAAGLPFLRLHRMSRDMQGSGHFIFLGYCLFLILFFAPIYAAKTRGGWKWRWGGKDRR